MSISTHVQAEASGTRSKENVPEVLMRAGKYFVCSSCGTMVEIPAEVLGQLVVAVGEPPQDPPQSESPSRESPQSQPLQSEPPVEKPTQPEPKPSTPSPSKPVQRPRRTASSGELIDGLHVPSAEEMERALAWVTFHSKILDRQGSELHRLRKLLKANASVVPPGSHACEDAPTNTQTTNVSSHCRERPARAHEDVTIAPSKYLPGDGSTRERGPP